MEKLNDWNRHADISEEHKRNHIKRNFSMPTPAAGSKNKR